MSEFDLSGVFEGVKPQEDNILPRLVTMIQVTESIQEDDIPSRLLVNVNGGEIIRYQNLSHLPVEVQDVISTLPGSMGFSKEILLEKLEKLKIVIEKLHSPDPPKFLVGDRVRVVVDPWEIMMNKNLIGKMGVVEDIEDRVSFYRYTVKVEGRNESVIFIGEMLEKINE